MFCLSGTARLTGFRRITMSEWVTQQAASHYWTKKIESSAGSLAFNQRWSDFIAIQRNLKFEIGSSLFPLFMIWLEHFYWKRQILNLTFSLAPWSFSPPPASFEWQPPLIRIRPQTPKYIFLNTLEKKSWNQKYNSIPSELPLHWKQDNIKTRQILM